MRILRIETKNVLSLPDGAIDFPLHAVVVGANDSGKSCLHRLLLVMLGWGGESLAALARRDENGQALLDVVPECVMYVEGDVERTPQAETWPRYRFTRRGTDLRSERDVDGAWVKMPGSAAQALASVIPPKAAADSLLAGGLTDAGRVKLLLDVVPPVPYDVMSLLAEAGISDLPPVPTPSGQHVLDFLEVVEKALSDHRLGAGKAKAAAEGVVAKLAAGLPATTPEDPRFELAQAEIEGRELGERVKLAEQARDHAYATACERAKTECDSKTQIAERDFDAWVAEERAALERRIAKRKVECEVAIDAFQTERGQAMDDAWKSKRDADAALQQDKAALAQLREQHAALKERAAAWERDAGLRAEVEKSRADAEAHAERHRQLTQQIRAVRALAARYIGDALQGVRIVVDEDEQGNAGKPYVQLQTAAGWQAWADANEATRRQVALRWSELRQAQAKGGALRILDAAEALDGANRARLFAGEGQTILFCVGDGPLTVRPA